MVSKLAACLAIAGSLKAIQGFPFQKRQQAQAPTAPPLPDQSCKCLNWAEQYIYGTVKCGNGAELFTYTGGANNHAALTSLMREADTIFCKTDNSSFAPYFPQQNHDYCVRVTGQEKKGKDSGNWCYVSNDCLDKSAYSVFQSSVKAKPCKTGEDYALGDLQPTEIFELAKQQKV